ncbi:hypothetical protein PV417_32205, partial [Streptomyces sp. ME19-03-3]|nr:hypothetical protein [Streptomyces sp. ME19-03-3]
KPTTPACQPNSPHNVKEEITEWPSIHHSNGRDHGLDVPQAALLISVAEVVPQGGVLIECSEVRHGLCFDAFPVNHWIIVPASARLLRSDIHE